MASIAQKPTKKERREAFKQQERLWKEGVEVFYNEQEPYNDRICVNDLSNNQKRLGNGVSGTVWREVLKGSTPVAVKNYQMKKRKNLSFSSFKRELLFLRALEHPNLPKCYGWGYNEDSTSFFIVLGFCSDGCLTDVIQARRSRSIKEATSLLEDTGKPFPNPFWHKLCSDIAKGLAFMHSNGSYHKDISTNNVLVHKDENGVYSAVVADFCQSQYKHEKTKVLRGTLRRYSPETVVSKDNADYTFAADVFMYGYLLYEVLEARAVFDGCNTESAIKQTLANKRPQITRPMMPYFEDIMTSCWSANPDNRPTLQRVVDIYKDNTS